MATTTSLSFHIFARYHGSPAFNRARRDLAQMNDRFDESVQRAERLEKSFKVLSTAAIALAPALVPVGAQLGALAGGLAAASVAAGGAALVFGAAMKGAIERAGKMGEAQKKAAKKVDMAREALARAKPGTQAYENAQRRLTDALKAQAEVTKGMPKIYSEWISSTEKLKDSWNSFVDKMAPTTLRPAITVVNALAGSISKLSPVVKAVAPLANEVANAFSRWTTNGGLDRFIGLLIKFGVPALHSFSRAARDVLAVLGIGFRAFLPTGMRVVSVIEHGAAALRKWAEGGGFQRFLAYVSSNSGQVKAFFAALLQALRNIAAAMKGVAPLSLAIATALARIVAAIPPPVLSAMIQMFILWRAAMLGLIIIERITVMVLFLRKAILALRAAWFILSIAFAASPLGWIVIAIGAVVVAIVLIATKTRWFQNIWNLAWRGMKALASAAWNVIRGILRTMAALFSRGLPAAAGAFGRGVSAAFRGIRGAAGSVFGFLRSKVFGPMANAFSKTLPNAARAFGRGVASAFNGIKGAMNGVWRTVSGIVNKILAAFKKVKSAIGGLLKKVPGGSLLKKIPLIGGLFASGGAVRGPGTGTSDSIPAMLSNGEHILTAREVTALGGHRTVQAIRRMAVKRYAAGGPVGPGGGTSGGASGAPSASGVAQAKASTQDAISSILLPVASLFSKGVPAAASTMQTQVSQKMALLKNRVASSAKGMTDAVSASWRSTGASVNTQLSRMSLSTKKTTDGIGANWRSTGSTVHSQLTRISQSAKKSTDSVGSSWRGARNAVNAQVGSMIRSGFNPMNRQQNSVIPGSANVMSARVRGSWNQARGGIQGSYRALVSGVYNPTRTMYTRNVPAWSQTMRGGVTRAFTQMRDGVKRAWGGIKAATKDPVNWVISNTYGRGIRTLWNAVSNIIFGNGKKNLPAVRRLAKGGPVRGPGTGTADKVPAMLSAGEHVWTAREVLAAGGHHKVASIRSKIMHGRKVRTFGGDSNRFAEGGALGGANVSNDLVRGSLTPWIEPRLAKSRSAMDHFLGNKVAFRQLLGESVKQKMADILNFVEKDDAENSFVGGGFKPWRAWRAGDERRVGWHGVTINARSREMVENAQRLFKHTVAAYQGSWSHAAASAGTHSGGGAIDVGPATDALVGPMRASGWAAWRRTPAEGFSPHIHGIAVGDPTVAPGAAAQVRAFFAGRNGLANNGPDTFMGGAGGGGNAVFTSFWDDFALMASGKRMHGKAIASSYIPLGSRIRVQIGSKSEDGIIDDLGPAKFVYDRHKGKAVFDLNELMMKRMTGSRVNTATGNWKLLSVGSGRTLYGKRLRGFTEGGGVIPENSFDRGGYLPKGLSLAYNGTGRPEPVGHDLVEGGGDVHLHVHGNVYTKSSREFEDMLAAAYKELKRKGRLR